MLLNLLLLQHTPISEQLAIEEALLRADTGNWCILNQGSPPAIVMGISGTRQEHVNEERMAENPVTLIRRFSGGGTVIVNESTFFASFIFQKSDIDLGNCPQKVMHWTADLYKSAWSPLPLEVRENDYVLGEKKIGGNAQYFTRDRWLHHTTFLWDYKKEEMQLLNMPHKQPKYRERRSHEEFITTLKGHFPSMQAMQERLVERLQEQFEIVEGEAKIAEIVQRPHRKALEIWPESSR